MESFSDRMDDTRDPLVRLQAFARSLEDADTVARFADMLLPAALSALDADSGAVWLRADIGTELRCACSVGDAPSPTVVSLRYGEGEGGQLHIGRHVPVAERPFLDLLVTIATQNLIRVRQLAAARASDVHYRSLFDSIDEGLCIIEMLFAPDGTPQDYRFVEVNPVFEAQTGLTQVVGQRARTLVPDLEPHWFEIYGRVAVTGEPVRFTEGSEAMGRWFDVYAFRWGDPDRRQLAILFRDITAHRRGQQSLRQSEERFRLLTETVPQFIYMSDAAGNLDYVNGQWTRYTGLTGEATIAGEFAAAIHPDDLPDLLHGWDMARQRGESLACEYRVRRAVDGAFRWFLTRTQPLRDSEGRIVRWFGVATDIDDLKRAEEALRQRSAELEAVMDSAPVAIFVAHDPDALLVTANHAGCVLLCTSPGSPIVFPGTTWTCVRADTVLDVDELPLRRAVVERQEIRDAAFDIRYDDGTVRHILATAVPLFDDGGGVRGCLAAFLDVTEQSEQQARIADLNVRLRRAVAEGNHRIKNNLQVLSALIELQTVAEPGPIPRSVMHRLQQHVRTLAALHDLLTADSRLGDGLADTVSLRAALEKLVGMLQRAADGHRIGIVHADDVRLPVKHGGVFTLLLNEIVQNAVKHGGREISVTLMVVDGSVRVEVHDDGPGFPPDFDPVTAGNTVLELIESLSRWDLRGKTLYENAAEGGARVIVEFPLPTEPLAA
jgi:PAS domain S-box-containing protein